MEIISIYLESAKSSSLKTILDFELDILDDFSYQPLEWQLAK